MAQWVYSPVVKDHFMNPRNTWNEEEHFEADGVGEVGSLACGDQMQVLIKVKDDKIEDLRWLTYGCASAIASTSMMSTLAIGLPLEEAYFLSPEQITEALGGLPGTPGRTRWPRSSASASRSPTSASRSWSRARRPRRSRSWPRSPDTGRSVANASRRWRCSGIRR